MSRRSSKLTLALALASCALLGVAPASQASPTARAEAISGPLLGGVNIDGLSLDSTPAGADRAIAHAHALHAKIIRAELPWAVLEPQAPGHLDPQALAYTDRLLDDASAQGIGVIVLIDVTPCWASSAPEQLKQSCVHGHRGPATSYPPANPSDFAALLKTLAERYGNKITALEVWNEPDQANEKYFAGPNKAERYAELLKAGYRAVKLVDPQIAVLGGSLVGTNGVFLRLLYKNGIKGYYDGLAIHFYTLSLASIRSIRAVQLANGDAKPLWLDEFGWSDCYPRKRIQEEQACVTAAVQAQNITNTFRALGTTNFIAAATLYDLQDGGGDSFGVLTGRGVRKPSFATLSKVLASPVGPLSPVSLRLRKAGSKVIASGSGPVGDFMRLEAFQGGLLRYRAVFTLNRFNRFSLALPRALGTHNLRVRVYQQWAGPSTAAQRNI